MDAEALATVKKHMSSTTLDQCQEGVALAHSYRQVCVCVCMYVCMYVCPVFMHVNFRTYKPVKLACEDR